MQMWSCKYWNLEFIRNASTFNNDKKSINMHVSGASHKKKRHDLNHWWLCSWGIINRWCKWNRMDKEKVVVVLTRFLRQFSRIRLLTKILCDGTKNSYQKLKNVVCISITDKMAAQFTIETRNNKIELRKIVKMCLEKEEKIELKQNWIECDLKPNKKQRDVVSKHSGSKVRFEFNYN